MSGDEAASESADLVDDAVTEQVSFLRRWWGRICAIASGVWSWLKAGYERLPGPVKGTLNWVYHQFCVAFGCRVGYCPEGPTGKGYAESIPVFFFIVAQALALVVSENGTIRSANDTARTQAVWAFATISAVTSMAFVAMVLATKPVSIEGVVQPVHVFDRGAVILMRVFFGFSFVLICRLTVLGVDGDLPGQRAMDLLRVDRAVHGKYGPKNPEGGKYSGPAIQVEAFLSQFDFPSRMELPKGVTGSVRLAEELHKDWWIIEIRCVNEMPLSDSPQAGAEDSKNANGANDVEGAKGAEEEGGGDSKRQNRVSVIHRTEIAEDILSPATPFEIPEIDLRSRHRLIFFLIPRDKAKDDMEDAAESAADLIDTRKDGVFQVTVQPELKINNRADDPRDGALVAAE